MKNFKEVMIVALGNIVGYSIILLINVLLAYFIGKFFLNEFNLEINYTFKQALAVYAILLYVKFVMYYKKEK